MIFSLKRFIFFVYMPLAILIFFVSLWAFSPGTKFNPFEMVGTIFEKVQEEDQPLQWLSTDGSQIVNENGDPVVLRGVNLSSLIWEGYEGWHARAVTAAARDWQAQIIRTRVDQTLFEADPQTFFGRLDREIVNPAAENGIYVMLNPQISEGVDEPNDQTVQMWRAIALRYKDEPAVLYDLLNEPHDIPYQKARESYIPLIEAVREENPRSLIFVTSIGWGRAINIYRDDPFDYNNIVYRVNVYAKPGEFKSLFGDMIGHYPVFIGEFGPGGFPAMNMESVQALLIYADRMGIGWTAWNFHSEGCPCLLGDYQDFVPTDYGLIVKNVLEDHATDPTGGVREVTVDPGKPGEIYIDSLENNFIDLSWESDVELMTTQEDPEKHIISVRYNTGTAGLFLHTYEPVDISRFSEIVFDFHWGANEPFNVKLVLNDHQLEESGSVMITPESLEPGGFHRVRVPLGMFGATSNTIEGVMFQNVSGEPRGPIYLDNIKFQ